jgi:hypothetical protein
LREYFRRRGVGADVDWENLRETDVDPLFAALERLSTGTQTEIESEFTMINELACEAGTVAILEEAAYWECDWSEQFAEMSSPYERAFWTFLNEPRRFEVAGCFHEMDRRTFSCRRFVGTNLDVSEQPDSLKGLEAGISKFYRKQGRGRHCHVDRYVRKDPQRYCYFVYPEDYANTDLGFDENGTFQHRVRKSAFEIIFVYRPDDGVLDMYARGNKKQKETLQEIFCTTILGLAGLPPDDERTAYNLSVLCDRAFPFLTEPQDGVAAVHVRQLRLDVAREGRKRITLSAETSGRSPSALHDLMDQALDEKKVSLDEVHVSQAKLQFVFTPTDTGRPKTLTFELTCPDRCTLKDDPHDQIAKKYLKAWGIARD